MRLETIHVFAKSGWVHQEAVFDENRGTWQIIVLYQQFAVSTELRPLFYFTRRPQSRVFPGHRGVLQPILRMLDDEQAANGE